MAVTVHVDGEESFSELARPYGPRYLYRLTPTESSEILKQCSKYCLAAHCQSFIIIIITSNINILITTIIIIIIIYILYIYIYIYRCMYVYIHIYIYI